MYALVKQLARDDAGFIISAELVIVATLLVIGLITGMACVQEALIGEYNDLSCAIRSLDQSYSYGGMHGCVSRRCGVRSWTAGSAWGVDLPAEEVCFGLCTPLPRTECHDCVEQPCPTCVEEPCNDCTEVPLVPLPDGAPLLVPPADTGPCTECSPVKDDDPALTHDDPSGGIPDRGLTHGRPVVESPVVW